MRRPAYILSLGLLIAGCAPRAIQRPPDLEAADANLVGGAINAGTSGLHQQLVLRPLPGLGRPDQRWGRYADAIGPLGAAARPARPGADPAGSGRRPGPGPTVRGMADGTRARLGHRYHAGSAAHLCVTGAG